MLFIGITVIAVLALAAALVSRTTRQNAGSVPERFDFNGGKEGERTRRGVCDKAERH